MSEIETAQAQPEPWRRKECAHRVSLDEHAYRMQRRRTWQREQSRTNHAKGLNATQREYLKVGQGLVPKHLRPKVEYPPKPWPVPQQPRKPGNIRFNPTSPLGYALGMAFLDRMMRGLMGGPGGRRP